MNSQYKIVIASLGIAGLIYGDVLKQAHLNNLGEITNTTTQILKKRTIQIILGSTRKGRSSEKIGLAIKQIVDKRRDIQTQIVDLRDFNLPILNDEEPPAKRQKIIDPAVKKWSDKIKQADSFIIVVPEYNSGYPGVLKNALDSLYVEWNNKPVAFVGYSGGPSGAANAITQLIQVVKALQMTPITCQIKVPNSWKAFDKNGNFINKNIKTEINSIIDQLAAIKLPINENA